MQISLPKFTLSGPVCQRRQQRDCLLYTSIINASDLFFVREMCDGLDGHSGDAWSGLLSTGYFLPTILTTLGLIFYDAWQLSAVTEEEGRAKFFTQIFRTYSSVLFLSLIHI